MKNYLRKVVTLITSGVLIFSTGIISVSASESNINDYGQQITDGVQDNKGQQITDEVQDNKGQQITDEMRDGFIQQFINNMEDGQDKELLKLYFKFRTENTTLRKSNISSNNFESISADFYNYAVEQGYISKEQVSRAPSDKAILRGEMLIVVAGGRKAGYTHSADELEHSLNDNPSDRAYSNTSSVAKDIKNSSAYKNLLSKIKKQLKNTSGNRLADYGSIELNSPTDLKLAYHWMDYNFDATKSGSTWKIAIELTDVYDFKYQDWSVYGSSLGSKATAILNNEGYLAMTAGAVVPFDITVNITEKY